MGRRVDVQTHPQELAIETKAVPKPPGPYLIAAPFQAGCYPNISEGRQNNSNIRTSVFHLLGGSSGRSLGRETGGPATDG
jgi:hypothetical protein